VFLKFSRAGISAMRPTQNRPRGVRIGSYGSVNPTNPVIPRRLIKRSIDLAAMTGRQKGKGGPEKGRVLVSTGEVAPRPTSRRQLFARLESPVGSARGGSHVKNGPRAFFACGLCQ
jgi:hypothetical protein